MYIYHIYKGNVCVGVYMTYGVIKKTVLEKESLESTDVVKKTEFGRKQDFASHTYAP